MHLADSSELSRRGVRTEIIETHRDHFEKVLRPRGVTTVAMTARIPSSRPLSERQGDVHLPLAVACVILCLLLPGGSCQDGGRTVSDTPCSGENESLLLSPLIAAGRIDLAQERSRVRCLRGGGDLESYSGFISVDRPDCGSHLFFWFFPAQEQPRKAPLLLWLNGGPGRSSLYGAMFENGPYQLTEPVSESVMMRNVTWVKYFSMLYVDNPVGTGLSHTRKCYSTTLEESTANLYSFLQQFFILFPQFSANDFYIGGQSYAGKYVPFLGYYIHGQMKQNEKPRMRLKGFFIGSGFCDPETMYPELPEMLYTIGVYSDFDRRHHKQIIMDGWSKPGHNPFYPDEKSFWEIAMHYDFQTHPIWHHFWAYDTRLTYEEMVFLDRKLCQFLRFQSVRSALHATGINPTYPTPTSYRPPELVRGVRGEMGFLMDRYKVLHYTGNMDIIVNVRMTEAFLMATPWSGQAAYNNSQRFPWFHEGRLAGFVTKVHNFTRVVIRNAGHDAPADQPEWTLAMMQRFVTDQPFTQQLNNAGL